MAVANSGRRAFRNDLLDSPLGSLLGANIEVNHRLVLLGKADVMLGARSLRHLLEK
jgi:hypothetical protein